jgi:uncharacterized repeat protein (TIGR03803 family)
MKTCIKKSFVLPVLVAAFGSVLAGQASAQTFTTLYNFPTSTNSEGNSPWAGLTFSGNTLYGAANIGGNSSSGNGTIFAVNTDGTGFTVLHSFSANINGVNTDGARPYSGLVLLGNTLYGTAIGGGSVANGTVFKVGTDGTAFRTLHTFTGLASWADAWTNADGAAPAAGLVLSGTNLYGTASLGGSSGHGTVFKLNTDGTDFATLHNFGSNPTNIDGSDPNAGLVLSGNTLYGTTLVGGSSGNGSVFKLNTDGTGFSVLHSFAATFLSSPFTNSDGANPFGGLVLSGNSLYGTTRNAGNSGNGTVFVVSTNGTGFRVLHTFTAMSSPFPPTNSDGALPYAELTLLGNTLYGTTSRGGNGGGGTVFALNTDGTGFQTVQNFLLDPSGTNTDGWNPIAGLILSGNILYGTTLYGGSSGFGTIFSISLPPQLTLSTVSSNLVLTWPTNFTSFKLQSTTNLASSLWTTNLPAPTVLNGEYTVTNPISAAQQFYRLSQ